MRVTARMTGDGERTIRDDRQAETNVDRIFILLESSSYMKISR